MTTEKQILANRKNALKSSGPTSHLGKLVSSRNSTRHGFYATNVLLPDEDRNEYLRLGRRLAEAYAPSNILEEEQVRTIILTRWQLRRVDLVDTELFQIYRFYQNEERGVGTAFAHDAAQANAFSKLTRYEGFLLRKLQNAEKELARLKSGQDAGPSAPSRGPRGELIASQIQNQSALPAIVGGDVIAQNVLSWLKERD